ncbi:hypothetical protein GCK72_019955 [Caenorhabditis remanei]|uniref:Uncharacterized protein n=1 Tax=Caenorhabditis remanei TaxID=31234 RepID=A0A6A5GE28_CAERE|nr:hypothetical protein GCK72_019955 [Caenorhabditis remanei]KAF1753398.1 hypothetical protein GCK72_019955 [Caenorhabditis remanei]
MVSPISSQVFGTIELQVELINKIFALQMKRKDVMHILHSQCASHHILLILGTAFRVFENLFSTTQNFLVEIIASWKLVILGMNAVTKWHSLISLQ